MLHLLHGFLYGFGPSVDWWMVFFFGELDFCIQVFGTNSCSKPPSYPKSDSTATSCTQSCHTNRCTSKSPPDTKTTPYAKSYPCVPHAPGAHVRTSARSPLFFLPRPRHPVCKPITHRSRRLVQRKVRIPWRVRRSTLRLSKSSFATGNRRMVSVGHVRFNPRFERDLGSDETESESGPPSFDREGIAWRVGLCGLPWTVRSNRSIYGLPTVFPSSFVTCAAAAAVPVGFRFESHV